MNYPAEFWEWLCKLTDDYGFEERTRSIYEIDSNNIVGFIDKEIKKRILNDIVYQAIDAINQEGKFALTQFSIAIRIERLKGNIKRDSNGCILFIKKDYFYREFDTITEARLKALYWIWENTESNLDQISSVDIKPEINDMVNREFEKLI